MLRVLGILGNDQVAIAEARGLFHDLLDGHHVLDGEVASAVLSIVAANGDRSDHVDLVHGYENAKSPQDEDRFRSALSWVPDRAAVDATMDMVLDGRIRSHDVGYTVARMIGVPETGPYAWEVLKQHWDGVLQRIPALTARGLLSQVHHRSEPEVAADIRAWLADHDGPRRPQVHRPAVGASRRPRASASRRPDPRLTPVLLVVRVDNARADDPWRTACRGNTPVPQVRGVGVLG